MSIRIVIADDHQIVREGLCSLLSHEDNIEVVGEAEEGETAVRLAQELIPDLVIMDLAMPGLNGIEATRQINNKIPSVKVLALSMHCDKRFVAEVFKAGASGYLLKNCAFKELARAIAMVTADDIYLSPKIARIVIQDYLRYLSKSASPFQSVLSTRELEVLQLLSEGKTTKEMSAVLHLSVKTIETHRQQIMDKLNIHGVANLTKYAIRQGLSSVTDLSTLLE